MKEHFPVRAEQTEGLDFTLTPGQVTESVTVSAESEALLQTKTANIDGVISREEVRRLPQVGRDPYELVRLTPGVFGLGARDASGNSQGFPNAQGPGRFELIGLPDRKPGADQRQWATRFGEWLSDRRCKREQPGLGRRGSHHAEPGVC